jgi:hypothetical protein
MKFNMGCGLNKKPDCLNVDSSPESAADEVWDLEKTPWPWPSDCAEEVFFIHSLEHMGGDPKVFLAIMQELYRISRPGCRIHIHVPHPRHDNFLADPTHVRPVLPATLQLFDRRLNEIWRDKGFANTPLAFYLGVDFRLVDRKTMLDEPFATQFREGALSEAELRRMIQRENNVANEYRMTLEVRKDLSAA